MGISSACFDNWLDRSDAARGKGDMVRGVPEGVDLRETNVPCIKMRLFSKYCHPKTIQAMNQPAVKMQASYLRFQEELEELPDS